LLPSLGEGELELCLPSPIFGRGAGGEGKDLSKIGMIQPISTVTDKPLFLVLQHSELQLRNVMSQIDILILPETLASLHTHP
ncbi:MAG: hypothetical protein V7L30_23050, partial [Nostoc sp.]|uniref:hypothetical protein n=1 Tax=Nostoc sp. TaxID=1180 RepID=UPI002FF5CF8D